MLDVVVHMNGATCIHTRCCALHCMKASFQHCNLHLRRQSSALAELGKITVLILQPILAGFAFEKGPITNRLLCNVGLRRTFCFPSCYCCFLMDSSEEDVLAAAATVSLAVQATVNQVRHLITYIYI